MNLPIGIIALVASRRFVLSGSRERAPTPDLLGVAMATTALPLLVYALTELGDPQGTATLAGTALLLAGVAIAALFVRRYLRVTNAALALRLFSSPTYRAASVTVALSAAGLYGAAVSSRCGFS
jgi:DHA2 family multidrug resistance protein-like MFS transporter